MPLGGLVAGYREQIRRFFDHPNQSLLVLEVTPETELLAAKLVSSMDEGPESREVIFGYSGRFLDPRAYYEGAAQAILDNLSEHRGELEQEGVEVGPVEPLEVRSGEEGVRVEVLFSELVERVGRALWKGARARVAVVLRAEEGSDQAAFVSSVHCLASLCFAEQTKYVAFVGVGTPACAELPAPQRLNVWQLPAAGQEAVELFQSFLEGVARRILVVSGLGAEAEKERALRALEGAEAVLRQPVATVRLAVGSGWLQDAVQAAGMELLREAERRGLRLSGFDPRLEPVDGLAELCERYGRELLRAGGILVVLLDLAALGSNWVGTGSRLVFELTRAACSFRVRYVLLDGTPEGILPVQALIEAPIPVVRMKPSSIAIARLIRICLPRRWRA